MAFNEGKRIDVRDFNKNTAIGIRLPFNAPGVFTSVFSTYEQIKYNLINLLLTGKGERIENPNFGTLLRNYLFEPLTDISLEVIQENIIEEVQLFIPEIKITNIDIISNKDQNMVTVKIVYKISISGQTDTAIINFE
jgi:phage baseplate assembly protein W